MMKKLSKLIFITICYDSHHSGVVLCLQQMVGRFVKAGEQSKFFNKNMKFKVIENYSEKYAALMAQLCSFAAFVKLKRQELKVIIANMVKNVFCIDLFVVG